MNTVYPPVSIIVPAYREAANVTPLAERVFASLSAEGMTGELIVVDDDSRDGTVEAVAELAQKFPIRIIVRTEERGLSSAVLRGYEAAKHDLFIVMDADLQHPPEVLPEMVRALSQQDCDFVIGTRYVPGGRIEKDWPLSRRIISLGAKWLAWPLTPLSDPLSGLFGIHRKTWLSARKELDPVGYKIALEVYVKAGCRQPREVCITFGARHAGESKLTGAVAWHYLGHLKKLYLFRFPVLARLLAIIPIVLVLIGCILLLRN